ncbi:MAG: hypothetical protein A2X18_04055 [Bacteroidetes bacterium GWF2_40_14]|nr:MAG: hypothetical protein A2X18_04055 [Bacteroidetes bacterium GWF2_40_14]
MSAQENLMNWIKECEKDKFVDMTVIDNKIPETKKPDSYIVKITLKEKPQLVELMRKAYESDKVNAFSVIDKRVNGVMFPSRCIFAKTEVDKTITETVFDFYYDTKTSETTMTMIRTFDSNNQELKKTLNKSNIASNAPSKKESVDKEKMENYEIAKVVLSNQTFGILPDDNRTPYNNKNFMGFENKMLILQGIFARDEARHVCAVKNYKYNVDKEGSIMVTFDFTGRITTGSFIITMKKGDNYVEIIEVINQTIPSYKHFRIRFYGEVFPSDACDYMPIVNEL